MFPFTNNACITIFATQCDLGEGSSVGFHRDWRFFEYNAYRGEGFPDRQALGLYKTVMTLFDKQVDEENLLS